MNKRMSNPLPPIGRKRPAPPSATPRPEAQPAKPAPEGMDIPVVPVAKVNTKKILINGLPYSIEKYVGTDAVMELTGYTLPWIRRLVQQGAIPHYRPSGSKGGAISFLLSEVDAWLQQSHRGPHVAGWSEERAKIASRVIENLQSVSTDLKELFPDKNPDENKEGSES